MMAATILRWNIRGLRSNRRDFDILVSEIQPEVICLQETKLDHSPHPKTYQCANYDCYNKALRRRPEQLPCGGVSIYIKKGLYHKPIQLATHLQAVAVQVTLGSTPVNILSIYTPSPKRLTTQDLSRLIRGLNGHITGTSVATTTHGVVSPMTSEVTSWSDLPIKTICASSTMGLPHT